MYVTMKKTMVVHDVWIKRMYVNFSHPFNEQQSFSDLMLIRHADLVYNVDTLVIVKNLYNVELTDDLHQQFKDVLLIQEL